MSRLPGFHHTDDSKRKLSIANKGRKYSQEFCQKLSEQRKGKPRTPKQIEALKKYWDKYRGKIHLSQETKDKISKANKGMPEPKLKGRKLNISDAERANRAFRMRNMVKSPEVRYKLSLIGKEQAKYKDMGLFSRGRKHTEEEKKKISIGCKKAGCGRGHGLNAMEKNSNWKGGISFILYPIEFNEELKEKIRKITAYKCFLCSAELQNRKLPVHHIDYDRKNNNILNLVPLCIKCHIKTNYNRNKWTLDLSKSWLEVINAVN